MSQDNNAGDKVRLKRWTRARAGFFLIPDMLDLVGTEVRVGKISDYGDGPYITVNGWGWPLSAVEKVS